MKFTHKRQQVGAVKRACLLLFFVISEKMHKKNNIFLFTFCLSQSRKKL